MKFIIVFIFLMAQVYAGECELEQKIKEYKPHYAKLFSISYYKNFKILTSGDDRFIVTKGDLKCATGLPIIKSPIKRLVATSTTHLGFLKMFAIESTLVGFPGTRYIYNPKFHGANVKDINYQLSSEELLSLKPDLIMAYSANLTSEKKIQDLRKIHLPIVLNHDFEEKHPLARAEWMVFSASFLDKDEDAQKRFAGIEANYNVIKNQTRASGLKPWVLVGEIQNGRWATCGGESDLAILIKDAGGALYLQSKSAETQFLSLENVLTLKSEPSLWLTQNTWVNGKEANKDSRYKKFLPVKKFNNNKRVNSNGFNDFWEDGVSRPDLLLKDLRTIILGEKDLNSKLLWYKELQ